MAIHFTDLNLPARWKSKLHECVAKELAGANEGVGLAFVIQPRCARLVIWTAFF